jgi:hypothetical protein
VLIRLASRFQSEESSCTVSAWNQHDFIKKEILTMNISLLLGCASIGGWLGEYA